MPLPRIALASALSLLLAPALSSAGEQMMNRDRYPHHHHEQSVIGGNGLPSVVPGVGTFAGNLSAVRIKGNGIFVALDRRADQRPAVIHGPKVQIIEVSAETEDSACAFEAGVCVIRPGR